MFDINRHKDQLKRLLSRFQGEGVPLSIHERLGDTEHWIHAEQIAASNNVVYILTPSEEGEYKLFVLIDDEFVSLPDLLEVWENS